ncbi:uncharacterized protein LOC6582334 [Drosophila mojavensis]|uniref:Uncharacterized protein n=1 Tax=Drosophila mojavensis TaxID=7230 RepID=B4KWA6_DROMO|nr:uncharacterized protein LOC6582334 [Drosophila mojavensis]EDW18513.2 uncharacterized protein Dmoj_GI13285 [Drosophila mojavensis]
MFDWLYSPAMLGVLIALFPIVVALSKIIRQRRRTRTMRISERLCDSTLPESVAAEEPEKSEKKRRKSNALIDDQQLLLMRGTVDLITYRLSLIESSIYKDLNPKPHLTHEEYMAAAKQMKDLVRLLKHMPKLPLSMMEESMDISEGNL